MQRLLHLAAALAASLAISVASAHTVDKGLATISLDGQSVNYHLLLAVSAVNPQGATGVDLGQPGAPPDYSPLLKVVPEKIAISSNGKACTPTTPALTPPAREGALVTLDVRFACAEAPRTLAIRDNLFDVMGAQYHTIANVQWPGGSQQFVFMTQARELRVEVAAATTPRGAGSFFVLGIEHILTGYDHLLFLLALILGGGNLWSLFKIITAFTIAHSITLALAALNLVTLPEQMVEATIALSIAYVAAENLFMRKAVSHRWAVSFLFGLVHGFGFSNVLRELGLPKEGLVWALLNFNLGVETGQAMAVLIAVPVLFWLRQFKWEPRAVTATSVVVLAVGLTLFVERALFAS
jgi:hydrogenase/urease accessory protein HupE